MKLQDAEIFANKCIKHYLSKEWTFIWTKGTSTCGVCYHQTKQIGLSKPIAKINDKFTVENIILHEIAHAILSPSHNHDKQWKEIAGRFGINKSASCNVIAPNCYNYQCPWCKRITNEEKPLKKQEACFKCCRKYSKGKHDMRFVYKLIADTRE